MKKTALIILLIFLVVIFIFIALINRINHETDIVPLAKPEKEAEIKREETENLFNTDLIEQEQESQSPEEKQGLLTI